MANISSDTVNINDTVAPAYLKTLSQLANGDEISLSRFIDPAQFAAIQAGTSTYNAFTDLSSAFTSGARSLYAPKGIYRFSGDLPATAVGSILRGDGGGEYTGLTQPTAGNTIFERQDAGTATSAVITLGDGATIETLQVRPANFAAVDYTLANYPSGTGNVALGVKFGISSQARHVTGIAFPTAAFQLGTTAVLERCYGYNSDKGFTLDPAGATDGILLNCIGMFCQSAGADLEDNYWQVLGGRWEWNARYGLILGAESTCVGALLDRNGFAGIWVAPNQWGKVITGNYFSRNGVGGDGTAGRWSFSTPGSASYVAVPAGLSCHIQIDVEQAASIVGNRYRSGSDDSGQGADGPQFIYSSGSASLPGASPISGITIIGNTGDKPDSAILGFTSNYGGVADSGAVAGGPDTDLSGFLNTGLEYAVSGLASTIHAGNQSASINTSTITVDVLRWTSGRILVRANSTTTTNLFDVYFGTNAADGGYTTANVNLLGTSTFSSATMAANTADTRYNTITIHLKTAYWTNYTVYST